MLKRTILFGLFAMGLMLQSCYYDNEVYLYGAGGSVACDTTNVTYSGTIAPLMSSNCNSCHNTTTGNGVNTSDYTNLKLIVTNGKLVKSVNWTAGAIQMPLGGQKLSTCSLAKISKWVNNGALNN
jgi:hypothetical protein